VIVSLALRIQNVLLVRPTLGLRTSCDRLKLRDTEKHPNGTGGFVEEAHIF